MYRVIFTAPDVRSYLMIPKQGLRTVIQGLRKQGHKASDWQTLWHATPRKNVRSILQEGLRPAVPTTLGEAQGGYGVKGVYLGPRNTAATYPSRLLDRPDILKARGIRGMQDWTLLRVRVPKKQVRKTNKVQAGDVEKLERISSRTIPPKQIRVNPSQSTRHLLLQDIQRQRDEFAQEVRNVRSVTRRPSFWRKNISVSFGGIPLTRHLLANKSVVRPVLLESVQDVQKLLRPAKRQLQ